MSKVLSMVVKNIKPLNLDALIDPRHIGRTISIPPIDVITQTMIELKVKRAPLHMTVSPPVRLTD